MRIVQVMFTKPCRIMDRYFDKSLFNFGVDPIHSGSAESAIWNSRMQEAPLFCTRCESTESMHLNPWTDQRHKIQRKT